MTKLSLSDEVQIRTHHDVLNTFFSQYLGRTYISYQKGWKHITGKYCVWFPTIAYDKNGELISGNRGSNYINALQNDGEEILEYCFDEKPMISGSDESYRIVFAKKSPGGYSFIGLYKSAYSNEDGYNYLRRVHKRISTEIDTELLDEDFLEKDIIQKTAQVIDLPNLTDTEKDAIVKIRVGQSIFRDNLLKKHECKCMLCGLGMKDLLVASHIKEWYESEDDEKLDVNNGLLLCALHDALFDKHLISFNDDGLILISDRLSQQDIKLCNINPSMKIHIDEQMKPFMEFHRNKFFQNNK